MDVDEMYEDCFTYENENDTPQVADERVKKMVSHCSLLRWVILTYL
jgi:hypothetical protein